MIKYLFLLLYLFIVPLSHSVAKDTEVNTPVKIDFTMHYSSIYLTQVEIEGKDDVGEFLLDNGCSESFISQSLFESLEVRKSGTHKLIDVSNISQRIPFCRIDFCINGVLFKNVKTSILPDESFLDNGCDATGIIGLNIMKKHIWSISLDSGIYISKNIKDFPAYLYHKQKIDLTSFIDYESSDTIRYALFDLGMQAFLKINEEDYKLLNDKVEIRSKMLTNEGGGIFDYIKKAPKITHRVDDVIIPEFSLLGDCTIHNVKIGIQYVDDHSPHIGSEALQYFDVILDFRKKDFYSRTFKTEYKKNKAFGFGFEVIKDSLLLVGYIIDDAAADQSALQFGDSIIEINNKTISAITENHRDCEHHSIIWKEIYSQDSVLIKTTRLEEPFYIKREYYY